MKANQLSIMESSQELPELGTLMASTAVKRPLNTTFHRRTKQMSPAIGEELSGDKENWNRANIKKRRRLVSDDDDD
jgi:hypothetical protein